MRRRISLSEDTKFLIWVRFTKILSFIPFFIVDLLAKFFGFFVYHFAHRYRKQIFSNLAVCNQLKLDEKNLKTITKKNIQLFLGCFFELPKIFHDKDLSKRVTCENPEIRTSMFQNKNPFIVFCLHQANWELFFLEATYFMAGAAVAKPSKNKLAYRYMTALRTRFGGKIISSNTAIKEGSHLLNSGTSIGIVGDQGKARKNFKTDFLGMEDSFSKLPAILCYKNHTPIFVATMNKIKGKYYVHYSEPIYPNLNSSFKEDTDRIMKECLQLFEKAILANPESWLWIYNRYKKDHAACIIDSSQNFDLDQLRNDYAKYQLSFFSLDPKDQDKKDIYFIKNLDNLPKDYRFTALIDYTHSKKIKNHFMQLSVYKFIKPKQKQTLNESFIVAKNTDCYLKS